MGALPVEFISVTFLLGSIFWQIVCFAAVFFCSICIWLPPMGVSICLFLGKFVVYLWFKIMY